MNEAKFLAAQRELIAKIPLTELESDLAETIADIGICNWAISLGLKTYGNNNRSVSDRLLENMAIKATIEVEIKRRKALDAAGE